MGAQQARSIIESELGQATLDSTFSWIDLERPLGSATIAQVESASAWFVLTRICDHGANLSYAPMSRGSVFPGHLPGSSPRVQA